MGTEPLYEQGGVVKDPGAITVEDLKAGIRLLPKEPDMVNEPPHYNKHPKGIECIDVIEDFNNPNLANVVKYAWRVDSGGKWDDLEDLDKLIWYAQRERERRTK